MKTFCFILIVALNSCSKSDQSISFTGKIEKQGMTTYQYGTHTISNGTSTYALRSSAIKLENFEGKNTTITAKKIAGYPIEGGPDFLEVTKAEIK